VLLTGFFNKVARLRDFIEKDTLFIPKHTDTLPSRYPSMKHIKSLLLHKNGQIQTGGHELIQAWQDTPDSNLWLDIQNSDSSNYASLLRTFGCHELVIKDAFRERHPPKIEFFDDQVFFLYRGIDSIKGLLQYQHLQLSLFVSDRLLITVHATPSLGIDTLRSNEHHLHLLRDPILLALKIMHTSSGFYLDNLLDFEQKLVEIEDALQDKPDDKILVELTTIKSNLLKLRRVFRYHENISRTLQHHSKKSIKDIAEYEHEINDLNDRFERLSSLSQMYYEISADLIEGYISLSSHRLNNTMQILTVITAVFVPLSFLAGIYGMNFEYIPELKVKHGYFILLGSMAAIALGLITIFKKKKWF
jgi:magnesium transporter